MLPQKEHFHKDKKHKFGHGGQHNQNHVIQSSAASPATNSPSTPASAATNRDGRGRAPKLPAKPQPEWTSFTKSYTGMLNEIKGTPLFEAPKPMQAPADFRDKNKRCEYLKTTVTTRRIASLLSTS